MRKASLVGIDRPQQDWLLAQAAWADKRKLNRPVRAPTERLGQKRNGTEQKWRRGVKYASRTSSTPRDCPAGQSGNHVSSRRDLTSEWPKFTRQRAATSLENGQRTRVSTPEYTHATQNSAAFQECHPAAWQNGQQSTPPHLLPFTRPLALARTPVPPKNRRLCHPGVPLRRTDLAGDDCR